MRIWPLIAVVIIACKSRYYQPGLEPEVRSPSYQQLTTADVRSSCSDWPGFESRVEVGTGVIVSSRHVLTMSHVVRCPGLPTEHVAFYRGSSVSQLRAVVTREDVDQDLALLEIESAYDVFGEFTHPPMLAIIDGPLDEEHWCVATVRGLRCGQPSYVDAHYGTLKVATRPGDSGAGVYDSRWQLVGLVQGTTDRGTRIVRVHREWLEGL